MSRSDESPNPVHGDQATVAPNRGLRERQKLGTRLALRDIALDLFLQRGFNATQDVVECQRVRHRNHSYDETGHDHDDHPVPSQRHSRSGGV